MYYLHDSSKNNIMGIFSLFKRKKSGLEEKFINQDLRKKVAGRDENYVDQLNPQGLALLSALFAEKENSDNQPVVAGSGR